ADVRPVRGLDPAMGLVAVTGSAALDSDGATDPAGWGAVRQSARRALAHELCGLAGRLLDDAARHVTDRHQFGRPIAAFQTVRHRLTEVYVAVAAARAALDAAWRGADPVLADAAKVLSGRAAALAGRHCLQVTGAIGFTEDHRLPGALRRAGVLDALYGSADEVRAELGRSLLERRTVPRLVSLV
ncbi:MAG TPA: acyl-CoA dehydrogenase family protein, partial [Acidimicrobiia bacterium]|nr:acyl-CoA dehydrogenase family protein [Acidimicrobiia bacterium]